MHLGKIKFPSDGRNRITALTQSPKGLSVSQKYKLYKRLIAGKSLTFREFCQVIEAFGFVLDRTSGSHHIYQRPGVVEQLNVQPVGKDAKPYQIRQFLAIVETYRLTLDDA